MKKKLALFLFFILNVCIFAKCKYIFYFIGDGLGASQRQISEYYKINVLKKDGKLNMNSFPISGISTTHSKDSLVTDSAASGTALATGHKTNNGMIAVLPDGTNLKTLIDVAQEHNMSTGVVTTTRVTHATPAVFVAHNINRGNEDEIATYYPTSKINYLAGGGYEYFVPKDGKLKSARKDDKNLVTELKNNGYTVFIGENSSDDFKKFNPTKDSKVFAAFSESHLPYTLDRINENSKVPSLADLTQKGIDILSKNDNGFFMMIEGGRIDHADHAQDTAGVVNEVLSFDEAIGVALNFYKQHPKDTLIVITADHETGGMGLGFGKNYFLNLPELAKVKASVEDKLQKAYNGDDKAFYDYIAKNFGLTNLTPEEKAKIDEAIKAEKSGEKNTALYGSYKPTAIAVAHIVSERAGTYWTTFAHTGTQIPLSAIGEDSNRFTGFKDNVDISNTLADVMGGKLDINE